MSVYFSPLLSGSYSVDFSLYLCLKPTPFHVCVFVCPAENVWRPGDKFWSVSSFTLLRKQGVFCFCILHTLAS